MSFTTRPVIQGTNGMVTSTHYHATIEGLRILQEGGNVFDAGAKSKEMVMEAVTKMYEILQDYGLLYTPK